MAIEHYFYSDTIDEADFPPWPCPSCRRHSLALDANSFSLAETRASKESQASEDWDPEWQTDRFICLLVCQNRNCGEVSAVAGATGYRWLETAPDDHNVFRHLKPSFVEPAPDIFRVPRTCPKQVAVELRAAFSLFWNGPGAALNRVRTSLEALLDALAVQRKVKTKKGKFQLLSLHQRIERFFSKDPAMQSKLLAVKWLGNVGSHERLVTRIELLEAFELVEHILEIVIDKRPQRLDRMAREITKRKGRPRKPPF